MESFQNSRKLSGPLHPYFKLTIYKLFTKDLMFHLVHEKFGSWQKCWYSKGAHMLIETLYRENVSFRDRDLKRQIPCHTA